jgi:hypothetical protein
MRVQSRQSCQVKNFLSTCGDESVGVCIYCGRPFCERHGAVLEEGQEICSRKQCVAKREDLSRHLVYRDAVASLNNARHCGELGCGDELAAQCIRCKGLFCLHHVLHREETVLENSVKIRRMATLCRHCADRRSIWTKL